MWVNARNEPVTLICSSVFHSMLTPMSSDRQRALITAMAKMLWQAGGYKHATVALWVWYLYPFPFRGRELLTLLYWGRDWWYKCGLEIVFWCRWAYSSPTSSTGSLIFPPFPLLSRWETLGTTLIPHLTKFRSWLLCRSFAEVTEEVIINAKGWLKLGKTKMDYD